MRYTVTQLARESVGLCPFRGLYVKEFELSHSNRVNRIIKITPTCTQFAREDVGLKPFYNSYFKKNANCLLQNFPQTILRNHLGFITTAAIKLCFMQRQG